MDYLKKVEKMSQKLSIELETGLLKQKKKEYIKLSDRLNIVMDNYDPSNKLKTLDKIACMTKLNVKCQN